MEVASFLFIIFFYFEQVKEDMEVDKNRVSGKLERCCRWLAEEGLGVGESSHLEKEDGFSSKIKPTW